MSRPMSMPDFSTLLDTSAPLHSRRDPPRKKPSISLAAGLIMATTDSPKTLPNTPQQQPSKAGPDWSDNLFYAYAQKSDYLHSPPYILTFASASICEQWWSLVQREFPESTRPGAQLFILKGDDIQEQIQDNPRFFDLRNKWFYAESTGVIPLQDRKGHPVAATATAAAAATTPTPPAKKQDDPLDAVGLASTLDKMASLVNENSAQIRALSVAQSEGLQRMQEINESNASQIKALADSQAKLQAIVDQNASHYIALSNSSFSNQEQVKAVLQSNADQIRSLADGQVQLSRTCEGMMRSIEGLGNTVGRVSEGLGHVNSVLEDSTSNGSLGGGPVGLGHQILPPPRKLNRRIRGVWYEYDGATPAGSPPTKAGVVLDTPRKSPLSSRRT